MFIFRNYTIENLFPEDVSFSGYGDISYIPKNESTLVWSYQVPINFNIERCIAEINAITEKLKLTVDNLAESQSIFVCSLLDMYPTTAVDSDRQRLENAIESFNCRAKELASKNTKVAYIDVSEYFNRFDIREWINWRFYFISQMIVSPNVAGAFYNWFEKRIDQIKGSRKKCLVLDLDNTLWGGVLGEDGIDGIKVGGDYPGNVFLYFQEALISLAQTGVILAVCSKNNEQDVKEAWDKNPFIKLNSKYLSTWRINWNNKADNIRDIAKALNIGLDSMVFVDDSPTERELIRQQLPMVSVPDFPKKPYGLMEFYRTLIDDYFRVSSLTSEDKDKIGQYKANALRANERRQYSDLTDFIKSLEISISILPADRFNIQRISQMTQKTNQFNLTTKRYTEADIDAFVKDGHNVFCISVSDRFGDSGITGATIIKRQHNHATIDSFLLSCRILGKGIEDAFFKAVVNRLIDDGVETIEATYIPTAKNGQVSDFYSKEGMACVGEEGGTKQYEMKLNTKYTLPDYYKIN